MSLGLRVVRGPDWEWGDLDGGEGYVGTVTGLEEGGGAVVVWDTGQRYQLRCGAEEKYDLRILDSGPTGLKHNCACGWCSSDCITGILWKCTRCFQYYLCSTCYHSGKHSLEHEFERVDDADHVERTRLSARYGARRVQAWGIFPGAVVVRGTDWRWEDQDGGPGCDGRVGSIDGWAGLSYRSVAKVNWSHSQWQNVYCIGHKGKVDLQCVSPTSGGYYYPDHLPILGAVYVPPQTHALCAGDGVRVELDPELFRVAQEDHGGWNDIMAEYIGRDGTVYNIQDEGDVVVRYTNNKLFQLNRHCLTQVECPQFDYGDVVRVSDDIAAVNQMQCGHGEWADDMALSLGQVGRVVKVRANGDIRVAVNGSRWTFNPKCLSKAPGETPIEEITGQLHADLSIRLEALMLGPDNSSGAMVTAAAGGDLVTLRRYLDSHPNEINALYKGKAAIHIAVVEGYLPIVQLLIKYQADLEVEDENGERALHLCAYLNSAPIAKALVDAGADINAMEQDGHTALAIAASCGHMDVLRLLLDQPGIDLDAQEEDGRTALHRAVLSHKLRSLSALLEAGADPTVVNGRRLTPIHNAVANGFLAGVEELLKWYPELIGRNEEGLSPLNIAAFGGNCDIVAFLASHPKCDINSGDDSNLTPIHIAAHEGHTKNVERLVGYGADLNCTTEDGNTPLHLALGRNTMLPPSHLTPEIMKVKQELDRRCGVNTLPPNVVVGVFLVQEGASIRIKNKRGFTPLDARPPDVAEVIINYALQYSSPSFHGQLRQMESPFTDLPPRTPKKPLGPPRKPRSKLVAYSGDAVPAMKTGSKSLPAKNMANLAVNENTHTPSSFYEKDINPYAKDATASAMDAVAGSCSLELCSLCEENPVSVLFQPCHHLVLCSECGSRAKRCIVEECRAEVRSRIELCPMCRKNQPAGFHPTCRKKHRLCGGCVRRSQACVLCGAIAIQHKQ